ncbi:MAG: hypothetical protein DRP00_02510 [Candidatus Aenigmatarchaeota archaeon]|nr:MAG: hypothetical protein DRP00_02510 [Candidatus Aenigmarchaeota archaeon]
MITKEEFYELKQKDKILRKAAEVLRVEPKDLPRVIERFLKEIEEMNEKIQRLITTNKSS